jgi:cytochrome c6
MTNATRTQLVSKAVIAVTMLAFSAVAFGESGKDIFVAHCQSCHGPNGIPSPGMAKMMGVKPASEYTSSAEEMFKSVRDGKGKMKPFAGKLTDDQIRQVVAFFRTLK